MCFRHSLLFMSVFAGSSLLLSAQADDIIYDNTTTYLNSFENLKGEYGDQVSFAGDARTLTSFAIELFTKYTQFDFDETARVRLYANDGPLYSTFLDSRRPGTLLYDSRAFYVNPGFQTKVFDGLNIPVQDTVTFTIQFGGLDRPDESAGLLLYSPPTVGNSFDDFWMKTTDGWELFDTPDIKDNFSARFTAIKTTTSHPDILQTIQSGSDVEVTSTASVGKIYYLEAKDPVLGPADWTPRGFPVTAINAQIVLLDRNTILSPTRTYRVVAAKGHKLENVKVDKAKGKAVITSSAEAGATYALDAKSDLRDDWFRVVSHQVATGDTVTFEVPQNPNLQARFYRVAHVW